MAGGMKTAQWIPVDLFPRTILKVDDSNEECLLFKSAARVAGMTSSLQTVSDGTSAVDYLEGSGRWSDRSRYPLPTLVLLDLHMPRMDGFEVLRYIRGHPRFKELPVVIFSSLENETDLRCARQLGADGYIKKPADFDGLIEIARSLDQMIG